MVTSAIALAKNGHWDGDRFDVTRRALNEVMERDLRAVATELKRTDDASGGCDTNFLDPLWAWLVARFYFFHWYAFLTHEVFGYTSALDTLRAQLQGAVSVGIAPRVPLASGPSALLPGETASGGDGDNDEIWDERSLVPEPGSGSGTESVPAKSDVESATGGDSTLRGFIDTEVATNPVLLSMRVIKSDLEEL